MKIAGLVKNSFVDYPKHIAAVIFTNGCNLNCFYCHNRRLISGNVECNLTNSEILEFLKTRVGFLEGVVISWGEPTLKEGLSDFIIEIKSLGYKVKLDTNGTNHAVVNYLIENNLVDYIAMDYKAPIEKMFEIVGECDLKQIIKTKDLLLTEKVDYEFRTTFCPKLNVDDIQQIAYEIKGAKAYYIQKCNLNDNKNFEYIPNKIMAKIGCEKAEKYVKMSNLRGFD